MIATFRAYVNYGMLCSIGYDVDVELTDEEYERLKKSCKDHFRMMEDKEVSDIYEKAYKEALNLDVKVSRDDPKLLADKMTAYYARHGLEMNGHDYTDEEIANMLEEDGDRGIGYPAELEEELWYENNDEDEVDA